MTLEEIARHIEGRLANSKFVFYDAITRIEKSNGEVPEVAAAMVSMLHDISEWTRERALDLMDLERFSQITKMPLYEANDAIQAAQEAANVDRLPDLVTAIQTLQTDLAVAEAKLAGRWP